MAAFQQKILNMVKDFRRQWHLFSDSERTTVCGADCMLMALQLSMAEVNKQHCGDFTVLLSDVLETWNYFLRDKLGLSCEDMEAPVHYADIRKAYDTFLKSSNLLDLIEICQKCHMLIPESEEISSVQLLEFISGIPDLAEENSTVLCTPSSPVTRQSQDSMKVLLVVKKFFCAYLNLLVNSKNDLALAHVLNVPERGLGREAFTDLKHTAQERQMSIFLVATSFIRTIELGGKGYAPSLFDPLRTHVKGLSDFVNFIDKLEEIVGEVVDPRIAGGRILSTVKMHLIKSRNSRDPFCQAAEEVVHDLDLRIKNIINSQHEATTASTTGISPARPKLHAINHGTAYCGRDTVKALLVLLDEEAVNPPTKNKAELLYDDENLTSFGITSVLTLFRSPSQPRGSSPKPLRQRIKKLEEESKIKMKQPLIRSQFACTYKDDLTKKKSLQFFSSSESPACVHPTQKQDPALPLKDAPLAAEGMNSDFERQAFGTKSENIHQNGSKSKKEDAKLSCQLRNKSTKRKQVELNKEVICNNDNEPSQDTNIKRPKTSNNPQKKLDSKLDRAGKSNKTTAKTKLIAGQAKLTHFFRL
ncbi:PREDICTED: PCNA-interacting partner isoform X1 [Gavialis gangeticus]|uniref:PCNA-interacting partner isoform X1 n=1 Tax=Gavialis gangeticus TaxID=94835 RepID=UPI00092F36B9|nr:PREDICTED: PCNA-interacting partner isoform X1 [Gavialis gangeticus]XP_019370909.1 PREDICTED: PCNA-interacting partner isoform X1 [Gavialis gangeticus]